MARIAEDVLLLLLDNPSARPRIDRRRLGRLLAAALILDLALDCRVRPALAGEPAPAGTLVALQGPVPLDPAVRPSLAELERGPVSAPAAIAMLGRHAEDDVLDQLLRSGQIHQIQLSSHRIRRNTYAWPLHGRGRVDGIRAAVHAALFDRRDPAPTTAVLVALLHRAGALADALDLPGEARAQTAARAEDIIFGAWADDGRTDEVNLAVTAAAVLPAV